MSIKTRWFHISFGWSPIFEAWVFVIRVGDRGAIWDSDLGWRKQRKLTVKSKV